MPMMNVYLSDEEYLVILRDKSKWNEKVKKMIQEDPSYVPKEKKNNSEESHEEIVDTGINNG